MSKYMSEEFVDNFTDMFKSAKENTPQSGEGPSNEKAKDFAGEDKESDSNRDGYELPVADVKEIKKNEKQTDDTHKEL